MLRKMGKYFCTSVCVLLVNSIFATESAQQSAAPHPQSPEAIQQMADQLEADRKAREAKHEANKVEEEEPKNVVEETEQQNPRPIIQNRPLAKPKPVQLPAKAK